MNLLERFNFHLKRKFFMKHLNTYQFFIYDTMNFLFHNREIYEPVIKALVRYKFISAEHHLVFQRYLILIKRFNNLSLKEQVQVFNKDFGLYETFTIRFDTILKDRSNALELKLKYGKNIWTY